VKRSPPRVSSLLARFRGRIEVALEGELWRTLPAEVVLAAGLDVGVELDRPRARQVRRELVRHEAMAKAARSLARRDLSEKELAERLSRAEVAPAARSEAMERLVRAGALDDARFARSRAESLAERGSGDALIRHDLAGRGIAMELVQAAIDALESESARAERIVERRGPSLKTARHLARKGFSEHSIECTCGHAIAEGAPPAVP
jgi:SOS response regulatory protein OraA/RecX